MKSQKLLTIHPEGDMNVRTKLHDKSFDNCSDIELKISNVNLMVPQEDKLVVHQSHYVYG